MYSRVSNNRPVIIKDPIAQKFRSGLLIDALICINRPDVNCYSGRLLEKCYYSYEVLNDPATGKYQPGRKKVSNKHRPGGKKAENLLSTRVDYSKVESTGIGYKPLFILLFVIIYYEPVLKIVDIYRIFWYRYRALPKACPLKKSKHNYTLRGILLTSDNFSYLTPDGSSNQQENMRMYKPQKQLLPGVGNLTKLNKTCTHSKE